MAWSKEPFEAGKFAAQKQSQDTWSFRENALPDLVGAVQMGVPIMIGTSAKNAQLIAISIILGRKSTILLAAVSTSTIWSNCVDDVIRAGGGQLGVLCGHSFGAGNFKLVGIWLQMGLFFVTVLSLPLSLWKVMTGDVLAALGVPDVVAGPAGTYAMLSAPALLFEVWDTTIWSYYSAQRIVAPDAVIQIVFISITSFLIWLGVDYFDMDIYGVAIALSIKRVLRLLTLVGFCSWMGYHKQTWPGWAPKEVFVWHRWPLMFAMCLPIMIGTLFESMQFAVNAVFAARLGPQSSAAYDLLITMVLFLYTVVWGFCQGFSLLMAQKLGEGHPNQAKGLVKIGALVVYAVMSAVAVLLYTYMEEYTKFASSDPEVQKEMMSVRFFGSLFLVACGGVYLLAEVLIKQGRVGVVFATITLNSWLIGLPAGFFFSPTYGIQAIFAGFLASYCTTHVVLGYCVFTSDWAALSREARQNAEVEGPGS